MFHVPERWRWNDHPLPQYRSTAANGNNGHFLGASVEPGWVLFFVASDELGWEHVSVHALRRRPGGAERTPTWREMKQVKDLCWDPDDVVVQYHPRAADYVDTHPHTLHLWRPTDVVLPLPPDLDDLTMPSPVDHLLDVERRGQRKPPADPLAAALTRLARGQRRLTWLAAALIVLHLVLILLTLWTW